MFVLQTKHCRQLALLPQNSFFLCQWNIDDVVSTKAFLLRTWCVFECKSVLKKINDCLIYFNLSYFCALESCTFVLLLPQSCFDAECQFIHMVLSHCPWMLLVLRNDLCILHLFKTKRRLKQNDKGTFLDWNVFIYKKQNTTFLTSTST